ncbi:hypothetical protein CIP107534_02306 [Corynebacterium diphtheriae]|nr:hypothetical protein CIP107534_02306 [Corynebacterium diphtheriae]
MYGWGRGSGNYLRRGAVEVLERTREYGDAKLFKRVWHNGQWWYVGVADLDDTLTQFLPGS